MTAITPRRGLLIALAFLILVVATSAPAALAGSPAPSARADAIRSALAEALLSIPDDGPLAAAALASARAAYADEFSRAIAAADPSADLRVRQGFADLEAALAAERAPDFAAGRARVETAILAGSTRIVERAVEEDDVEAARAWILVREFRTATRFSRASADASVALDRWASHDMPASEALQTVRADLLGTYQALLLQSLEGLAQAEARQFLTRRAELAAQAAGYFEILEPEYSAQRGPEAARAARQALAGLQEAALVPSVSLSPYRDAVLRSLEGFQAAPLSPAAETRLAGQMIRYLSLVPVEYGRGVAGGVVTQPIEIEESAAFLEAARAAMHELRRPLDEHAPGAAEAAVRLIDRLQAQVDSAATGRGTADPSEVDDLTRQLVALLESSMPAEWLKMDPAGDFEVIDSVLDQMVSAARNGDYAQAESARLDAYALLEVGPEARLAFLAPALKARIEGMFWNGGGEHPGLASLLGRRASVADIARTREALAAQLVSAEAVLGGTTSPLSLGLNAGIIVFREGLEAVLILASLLASTRLAQQRRYRSPVWLGTGLAVLATLVTWFAARGLLNSLARFGERLEAVVSLVAVGVLLLITNWFFHKVYWTDWIASFHSRKRRLLAGEAGLWLGLIALGFASVYREGFETVLFLQALLLEGQTTAVATGVGLALVAILLVGWATFRLQVHLPYRKMLILTGVLIVLVLVVMVGKTSHVLQVVGWLPAVPVGFDFPIWLGIWLGVYGTWQGLSLQLASVLLVLGSYFLAERQLHRASGMVRRPNRSADPA